MEAINFNGKEIRKTMWSAFLGIGFLIAVYQLSDILSLFIK